jgi:hypothetical protein
MVGGKETGQHMSHYVIPGTLFPQTYTKLAATGWKLNLQSAHRPGQRAESILRSECMGQAGSRYRL